MELIGRAGLDARDVVGQRGEVGGEDRGRDLHAPILSERSAPTDRRNLTAVNPSMSWRSGQHRSTPSGSRGSGKAEDGSIRKSGQAARKAAAPPSFPPASSGQVA